MQDFHYQPGDVAACFGTDVAARVISLATASPLAPRGLRYAPSHVAILCPHEDRPLWVESTTLCGHPCQMRGQATAGVQAHPPARRIADYMEAGGRVDIYRLHGLSKLSAEEVRLLHRILVKHLLAEGGCYDLPGALISGTRLLRFLPGAELRDLFCSELVAAVLMRLGRLNHANPARFHPGRLLRDLVRTGKIARVTTFSH